MTFDIWRKIHVHEKTAKAFGNTCDARSHECAIKELKIELLLLGHETEDPWAQFSVKTDYGLTVMQPNSIADIQTLQKGIGDENYLQTDSSGRKRIRQQIFNALRTVRPNRQRTEEP